ncbi:MAG: hypothetical protein QM741_10195 [Rudaea sp.]|uniref:hypothetical protein n=1 Tax=Rudaea sp. TaxID=2136325 RepID=UPI0039E520A2
MSAQVDDAVRSLEASRAALAAAFAPRASSPVWRREGFAGAHGRGAGTLWDALCSSLSEAAGEQGFGRLRASLETARPALEDAVRRQPWTAVAVAGLCGAVAVWIVSTRRRMILSTARLWWRTAGAAMLASAAFKLYDRYAAGAERPASSPRSADPAGPVQED